MTFRQHFRQLLLEKDNRPKILKMGLSQEVADYLHQIHDKYSLWFADKFKKMNGFLNARDQLQFIRNNGTAITGILDWIRNTPNIQINNYSWEQAVDAATEYHNNLQGTGELAIEDNTILKKYQDGFYWVDLESTSDRCEADAMGHCATTSKGDTLWSLRKYNPATKSIEPFITISVTPDEGQWHQCKGKKNSKPKKEYWSYIADILITNNIFVFKAEYDAARDFGPQDFIDWLEESDRPDKEELIEKIQANTISITDFQKILDQYDFKHYGINLDNDTGIDQIYINIDFYLHIKYEDTDLPIECLELSKPAKKYLDYVLEYMNDIELDETDEGIAIRGKIEDSDNVFTLDEDGLQSFKHSCNHYQSLDKRFDYQEFLDEHLKKLLALDGCIDDPIGDFKNLVEELGVDYKTERDMKTLDLTVSSTVVHNTVPKPLLSSSSILKQYDDSIILKSPKQLRTETNYKSDKHADLMLYCMFWDFIKNHVFNIRTKQYRMTYFRKMFVLKYSFDFEETYNFDLYEQEINHIQEVRDKVDRMWKKYEKQVVMPFLEDKEDIDLDQIELKSIGTYSQTHLDFQVFYKDSYLGIINQIKKDGDGPDKEDVRRALKELIREREITGTYKSLDEEAVQKWLIYNIDHQLSFKGFFESRISMGLIDQKIY